MYSDLVTVNLLQMMILYTISVEFYYISSNDKNNVKVEEIIG